MQLDASGNQLALPRNHMLNTCLSRESTHQIEHSPATVSCMNDSFVDVDATGTLRVRDGTFAALTELNLLQLLIERDLPSEDGGKPPILSPLSHFRIFCSQPGKNDFCHSRHVVVSLAVPEQPLPDPSAVSADPKKKKPPAKGAPFEAEKRVLVRILIVDVLNTSDHNSVVTTFQVKVVHEILLDSSSTYTVPAEGAAVKADPACDSKNLNVNRELFDGFWADLSLDGCLLSVVCSSMGGGCKVFALDALSGASPAPPSATTEAENGIGFCESQTLLPLRLSKAVLAASIPAGCALLQSSRIRNALILPDYSASASASESAPACACGANILSPEERLTRYAKCTLLLTLQQAPRCLVLGFRAKGRSELEARVQAAAAAAGSGGGAKGKPADVSKCGVEESPLMDVCVLTNWSLTAPLTAFAVDPLQRALLATGARDGTVDLWSLPGRCLLDTLGRHRGAPVTCLSVRRDPVANLSALCDARVAVTSGAADGTLCFYAASSESGGSSGGVIGGAEHVRLVDYRYDAHNSAVLQLRETAVAAAAVGAADGNLSKSRSMLFAQYSSGAFAVYVGASGSHTRQLIGRTEKRERIDYNNVFSSFCSWSTLPVFEDPLKKAAALREAEEAAALAAQEAEAARIQAIQQAAVEAEKAAKAAAAKGGKGGAAAAPVEAALLPAEEPVPEEEVRTPYVYVPRAEEIQEHQVDVIPYEEMRALIGSGSDSSLWQTRSCILALSSTHVACVANRAGQPCVVMYNLQSMVAASVANAQQPRERSAAASAATKDSGNAGNSSSSTQQQLVPRRASKVPPVLSTVAVPQGTNQQQQQQQQLRLTEARLQQLENSFPGAAVTTQARATSQQQLGTNGAIPASSASSSLDPAALARNSILRSRTEKTKRKSALPSIVNTLSSIIQSSVITPTVSY